jgi:hypothetical protein
MGEMNENRKNKHPSMPGTLLRISTAKALEAEVLRQAIFILHKTILKPPLIF